MNNDAMPFATGRSYPTSNDGVRTGQSYMTSITNPNGGMDWGGLLGTLGSAGGVYAQGNAQNNSANLAQQYARATGQLNPFSAQTSGGLTAGMNNGNVNLNYGPFNPAYGSLAGATGSAAGTAGGISAPSGLNDALGGAFGNAAGGLGAFAPGGAGFAANNAFLGAGNAAGRAGMPQQDMMQNYMQQLQALQAPGIQHQTDQLAGTLFGNGQTGSSSGGFLAQQFGQGLASQNTQNALAASQLGLQGQAQATNTAGVLGGLGNSLLGSAFNNFSGMAGLPGGLQGQYLSNANAGIGGAGALTNQGLGVYNAGLQTALGQNQASSRAGYLTMQGANSPNQQSPFGQAAAGFFGSLGGQAGGQPGQSGIGGMINQGRGLYNQFQNLFGGGASPADLYGTPGGMMSPGNISAGYANAFGASPVTAMGPGDMAAGYTGDLANAQLGSQVSDAFGGFSPASGGATATGGPGIAGPQAAYGAGEGGGFTAGATAGALPFADTAGASAAADLSAAQMLPSTEAAFGAGGAGGGSSAAGSGATMGAGAGAATALGIAALPIALAGLVHSDDPTAKYWSDMSSAILNTKSTPTQNDPTGTYAHDAAYGELLAHVAAGKPTPYSQAQLNAFGITPDVVKRYQTTPLGTGFGGPGLPKVTANK